MTVNASPYFRDLEASADLGRLAKRGGVASVLAVYSNGVLQIVGAVVLARLLTPEDFGLVAIATVLTRFAPLLIDLGTSDATTQKSRITQGEVSALFFLNCGIGFAVAVTVSACGPLIAWLYQDLRLQFIVLLSTITFIFTGLSCQHFSLLRRTMQFAVIAKIQILSALLGFAVAVLIAISGYGYWALVARPVLSAGCLTAGAWLACKWRPGRAVFNSEVKTIIRFGMHVLGYSITQAMTMVADRIALGLFYLPRELGLYQNASNMYENAISAPFGQLHGVGSAALSKLRPTPDLLQQKYEASLSLIAFFVMPTVAILSVTGQDATVILLGEKWRESGLLLSIMALRGMVEFIEGSQGWLHISSGRPERWKNWGVAAAIVRVLAILGGLSFGTQGVAVALVVAGWLIALPSVTYAGRPFGIGASLVIRAVGGPLFSATIAIAAGLSLRTFVLDNYSNLLRILLVSSTCASTYLLVILGLFRITEPIKIAARIARDVLGLDSTLTNR